MVGLFAFLVVKFVSYFVGVGEGVSGVGVGASVSLLFLGRWREIHEAYEEHVKAEEQQEHEEHEGHEESADSRIPSPPDDGRVPAGRAGDQWAERRWGGEWEVSEAWGVEVRWGEVRRGEARGWGGEARGGEGR